MGAGVTTKLRLRVSPGALRPQIAGRLGDAWKVRVAESPERGRANAGVLRLLAKTLGVDVHLVSGHSSRDKVVAFELDAGEAERLLSAAAGKERK